MNREKFIKKMRALKTKPLRVPVKSGKIIKPKTQYKRIKKVEEEE